MKFLANENFPMTSIHILRRENVEILSISENSPGIDDDEVMDIANKSNLVILTFDRDYGELIYFRQLPPPIGVIYFRKFPNKPRDPASWLLFLLRQPNFEINGKFTTFGENHIRQRPLPKVK